MGIYGSSFSAERCKRITGLGLCHNAYCRLSVGRLSVTRVYSDKTSEGRITRFYAKISQFLARAVLKSAKFDDKIRMKSIERFYGYCV